MGLQYNLSHFFMDACEHMYPRSFDEYGNGYPLIDCIFLTQIRDTTANNSYNAFSHGFVVSFFL